MTFDEYQKQALTTLIESDEEFQEVIRFTLGLVGEAGEVAEKIKKIIRDNNGKISSSKRAELSKELGDVLWYLAGLVSKLDLSFDEIAQFNLDKLQSRQTREQIGGSGDNR